MMTHMNFVFPIRQPSISIAEQENDLLYCFNCNCCS